MRAVNYIAQACSEVKGIFEQALCQPGREACTVWAKALCGLVCGLNYGSSGSILPASSLLCSVRPVSIVVSGLPFSLRW